MWAKGSSRTSLLPLWRFRSRKDSIYTGICCGSWNKRLPVSSPTFTILQVYDEGRLPFYHFDVYRISDPEEMYEIGFEEYIEGEGVCFIEWANLIEELLPEQYTEIHIDKDLSKGFDYRLITVEEVQR